MIHISEELRNWLYVISTARTPHLSCIGIIELQASQQLLHCLPYTPYQPTTPSMLITVPRLKMPRLPSLSSRPFLFGSASILFLILVFSLTPITSPLPPYTGEYEVGILDLETQVEKKVVHDAVLKETGQKAFEVCLNQFVSLLHSFIAVNSSE